MMLELLAAAQAVDPTTIPLWAVVVMAAGMYPVGIMLGAPCSPCCNCGCPPGEQLPDAIKVSFSGLTKSATKVDGLLSLEFSSCFGGGASGTAQAPHGLPDAGGPISGVTLTNGGSGYAVRGRVEPTGLYITAPAGSGAEFSISLTESADDCGLPYWEIASVTVTKQGNGYGNNAELSVSLGQDECETLAASLTLKTQPTEPTITADVTATAGTGLQLSVATKMVASGPDRWGVDTVSVVSSGSGYSDKQPVAFTPGQGQTEETPAVAVIRERRDEPNPVAHYYGAGSGASFTPALTKTTYNGDDIWEVSSVTVTGGGSGYANNQTVIFFGDTLGQINDEDSYWTIVTDGNGAVASLTRITGGKFWASSGIVVRVEVSSPGSYYDSSTIADSVVVNQGGRYYKERSDMPAHVAAVTATISQDAPSNGTVAELSAVVDDDPASATFGKITSVSVDDGGDGYLEWSYAINEGCCITSWNGVTRTLRKSEQSPCVYRGGCCSLGTLNVRFNGADTPPDVWISEGCPLEFFASPEDAPFSCDSLEFTATDIFGTGTVSVTSDVSGDTNEGTECPGCCSDLSKCSEEECLEALSIWKSPCRCDGGGCSESACDVEYLVSADAWYLSFYIENENAVLFEIPGSRKTYDFSLNAANNWSDNQTQIINSGAYVVGGQAYATNCAVVVAASSEWVGSWNGFSFGGALTGVGHLTVVPPRAARENGLSCPYGSATGKTYATNLISTSGLGRIEASVTVVT